ncbi:hypothetical protein CUMW_083180 [Citrus unshiu]|nr:hypothetical protein CUMW_083180 [Citrus unshiu]
MRQQRFVGILNSFDIVAFLAKSDCLEDQDKAMKTPVSQVIVPNNSLLKQVDPGTRCYVELVSCLLMAYLCIEAANRLLLWIVFEDDDKLKSVLMEKNQNRERTNCPLRSIKEKLLVPIVV